MVELPLLGSGIPTKERIFLGEFCARRSETVLVGALFDALTWEPPT